MPHKLCTAPKVSDSYLLTHSVCRSCISAASK